MVKIEELEEQIEEIEDQIKNIRREQISGENVYRLLLSFDELYDSFSEVERKRFMQSFIERIDGRRMFRKVAKKPENGCWIRNIVFNFPIPTQGGEVRELPLERQTMDEACVFNIMQIGELTKTALGDEAKATITTIPWKDIYGMRNRIVHGYSDVCLDVVWDTAKNDIPPMIDELRHY